MGRAKCSELVQERGGASDAKLAVFNARVLETNAGA